jgi:hypothetical protein
MNFQIIDKKQNCSNIYYDNQIVSNPDFNSYSGTWSYHSSLRSYKNISYASLYTKGKTLDECCPDILKDEWNEIKDKHIAYLKSFKGAKVNINEHCYYDLVPQSFVIDYFKFKTKITNHVLKTYDKPENYDFLLDLSKTIFNIEQKRLDIDIQALNSKLYMYKTRQFKNKLERTPPYISYNIFGTSTGRLATNKDSFPILTMNKEFRSILKPNNDWFVEIDFNAAELRCLLALNNSSQPEEDLHEWHGKIFNKIYNEELSRDEIKKKMFAWLYGGPNISLGVPQIERMYNKNSILKKYWKDDIITNPFNRNIPADEYHALNALIQSTMSDIFLRRVIAVDKLLKNKKTHIAALIHDSLLLDFAREDKDILKELVSTFEDTPFGKFKANSSVGTNFGNMKRI